MRIRRTAPSKREPKKKIKKPVLPAPGTNIKIIGEKKSTNARVLSHPKKSNGRVVVNIRRTYRVHARKTPFGQGGLLRRERELIKEYYEIPYWERRENPEKADAIFKELEEVRKELAKLDHGSKSRIITRTTTESIAVGRLKTKEQPKKQVVSKRKKQEQSRKAILEEARKQYHWGNDNPKTIRKRLERRGIRVPLHQITKIKPEGTWKIQKEWQEEYAKKRGKKIRK